MIVRICCVDSEALTAVAVAASRIQAAGPHRRFSLYLSNRRPSGTRWRHGVIHSPPAASLRWAAGVETGERASNNRQ